MTASVVRAELYKARSTRSTWWLGAAAVVSCVAWAVLSVVLWLGNRTERQVESTYGMAGQGTCSPWSLGFCWWAASIGIAPSRGRCWSRRAGRGL